MKGLLNKSTMGIAVAVMFAAVSPVTASVLYKWTDAGMTAGWYDVDNWTVVCGGCTPDSTGPNETDEDAEFQDNGTNSVSLPSDSPTIGAMTIKGDTDFAAPANSGRTVTVASLRIDGTSGDTVVTMTDGRIKT